jgi:hypothetical protein
MDKREIKRKLKVTQVIIDELNIKLKKINSTDMEGRLFIQQQIKSNLQKTDELLDNLLIEMRNDRLKRSERRKLNTEQKIKSKKNNCNNTHND